MEQLKWLLTVVELSEHMEVRGHTLAMGLALSLTLALTNLHAVHSLAVSRDGLLGLIFVILADQIDDISTFVDNTYPACSNLLNWIISAVEVLV